MNLSEIAKTRYSCKAFDPSRKIPAEDIAQLEILLQYAPSSVNAQPWHFVITSTEEGKARIAKAVQGLHIYNDLKIRNASHVIVFCVRQKLDDKYLLTLLEQEEKDGRFAKPEAKAGQHQVRNFYVNLHHEDLKVWMNKQLYLAFGTLLLGAAVLKIDACPMEGFDPKVLDEELDLNNKGFTSVLIVCLGYRSGDDFNAALPKSRLPAEALITRI